MPTTPVAIFDVDTELLRSLDATLGPPIDSYLRGWQVWIEPVEGTGRDGEDEVELEFRLHPPGGFAQPVGLSHHDLWDEVIVQVADGARSFTLGQEERSLASLWTLLEVFPAFGEDVTADQVAGWASELLGRSVLASGDVDHERIGGAFKREGPAFDLPVALRAALGLPAATDDDAAR